VPADDAISREHLGHAQRIAALPAALPEHDALLCLLVHCCTLEAGAALACVHRHTLELILDVLREPEFVCMVAVDKKDWVQGVRYCMGGRSFHFAPAQAALTGCTAATLDAISGRIGRYMITCLVLL
jgi:hypothetical protein